MGFHPTISDNSPFTLQNIPFGTVSTSSDPSTRCAVAIGSHAIDLRVLSDLDFFAEVEVRAAFKLSDLRGFAAMSATVRTDTRQRLIDALQNGSIPESCAIPLEDVTMHLPMEVKGYTDFYCSLEHCQNCSAMSAGKIPENVLLAPSAYNGRASSVLPSPQLVRRPNGVFWTADRKPTFGPTRMLDYELEMGYIVSSPLPYGQTLSSLERARDDHIFGFVLLNDWSARDVQGFEMPPLGPFNSKAFATTISPWVVTIDALKQFMCAPKHEATRTPALQHLAYDNDTSTNSPGGGLSFDNGGTFDIRISAHLVRNGREHKLCTSNLRYLYWTPLQQLLHHASSGCGLRTGDVMGTGTVSGDKVDATTGQKIELACLYEATQGGTKPIPLDGDGDELIYLRDGDEIVLRGWCGGPDTTTPQGMALGFGECRGVVGEAIKLAG